MTLPPPPPCWIEGLSEEEYRKAPGLSSTMVRSVLRSPAHMQAGIEEPKEITPAQTFGTRLHQAVFFGMDSLKAVVKPKGMNFSTTLGKAWRADNEEAGKTILSEEDYRAISTIASKLSSDTDIGAALTSPLKEIAGFAGIPVAGEEVPCKVKLDCLPAGNTIVDLKTTTDATVDAFAWAVIRYGYHVQAYHYMGVSNAILQHEGKPPKEHFMFVAVEKTPPFAYRKFLLSTKFLLLAETEWLQGAESYAKCLKRGEYPSYSPSIAVIDPPRMGSDRWLTDEL